MLASSGTALRFPNFGRIEVQLAREVDFVKFSGYAADYNPLQTIEFECVN